MIIPLCLTRRIRNRFVMHPAVGPAWLGDVDIKYMDMDDIIYADTYFSINPMIIIGTEKINAGYKYNVLPFKSSRNEISNYQTIIIGASFGKNIEIMPEIGIWRTRNLYYQNYLPVINITLGLGISKKF